MTTATIRAYIARRDTIVRCASGHALTTCTEMTRHAAAQGRHDLVTRWSRRHTRTARADQERYRAVYNIAEALGWDVMSTQAVRELAERITGEDYTLTGPDDLPHPSTLTDPTPAEQWEVTTPEDVYRQD